MMNDQRLIEISKYLLPELDNYLAVAVVFIAIIVFVRLYYSRLKPLSTSLKTENLTLTWLSKLEEYKSDIEPVTMDRHIKFMESHPGLKATVCGRVFDSIARAGILESRLDVKDIVDYAEDSFERQLDSVRVILSSFIIIGLLGTFFGLADSFASLSHFFNDRQNQLNVSLQLTGKLRSAFAPSITGVILTLIAMYLHNRTVSKLYTPYISKLKETIITIWIPFLYPTSPQKWSEVLEKSSKELSHVLAGITKASENSYSQFAGHVNQMTENLKELTTIISTTVKTNTAFKRMMDKLVKSSEEMSDTSSDIRLFYSETIKAIAAYKDDLELNTTKWSEQLSLMGQKFENIQQLIEAENTKTDNILKSVEGNLTETRTLFSTMSSELPKNLEIIGEEIKRLGDPLRDSASKIDTSVTNFFTYNEREFRPFLEGLGDKIKVKEELASIKADLGAQLEKMNESNTKLMEVLNKIEANTGERKTEGKTDQGEAPGYEAELASIKVSLNEEFTRMRNFNSGLTEVLSKIEVNTGDRASEGMKVEFQAFRGSIKEVKNAVEALKLDGKLDPLRTQVIQVNTNLNNIFAHLKAVERAENNLSQKQEKTWIKLPWRR